MMRAAVVLALLLAASPALAILEFPLSGGRLPNQIAAGPDGALWFTEVDRIGRISTGGVVTEFAIGAVSIPEGIVAGPDGALWFTEIGGGRAVDDGGSRDALPGARAARSRSRWVPTAPCGSPSR